ncbi:hypothetical protein EIKCOROL_02456 [Eikenella corrodens ATCC 23834]|uniref:Uncharacterized protein n=1 Tax=Eikenella corrodens ATCC 23834 TaxID=546274 RepID=C0DYJ2_EIKCO|nr:hypothetical protein EIKCOROL_02456 [Eikenella corrodens ATCC 23834]
MSHRQHKSTARRTQAVAKVQLVCHATKRLPENATSTKLKMRVCIDR